MDGVAKAVLSLSWYSYVLLTLALLAAYLWYRVAYMPYSVFKKLGIPGPTPRAFFGSAADLADVHGVLSITHSWIKQYGKVCGLYIGPVPFYLIADLDILKQIMVKQFPHFANKIAPFQSYGYRQGALGPKLGILFRVGEDWTQTRRILTPTFSSKKMKLMVPLVEESCIALCERIQKVADSGKSGDIWRICGQFSMETILASAFGYKVEILRGETEGGDELLKLAEKICDTSPSEQSGGVLLIIHSHFQWLTPVMRWLGSLSKLQQLFKTWRSIALPLVQARKKNPKTDVKDFLQLVIDARAEDSDNELADQDDAGGGSQPSSPSSSTHSKKFLTDEDIVILCAELIVSAYETTSNNLSYTAYLLAINPDKQDKLCAEIDAYYEENEEASLYDAAHAIEYLDWVNQESLRIYPPVAITARHCQKTCTIEGFTFVEGSRILIPTYEVHHSPEYWEDPEQFIPERFHPEEKAKHHPMAHMPFGAGPRSCIGMRFALMETKMGLVSILRKFKFERAPDTEVPLKIRQSHTCSPVNSIYLKVVARN